MKMDDNRAEASVAMLQLWELDDNISAAHEISIHVSNEATSTNPNLLRATAILRMTMSWIVITLWKVHELWQRYAYLASVDTKRMMGQLDKEILDRNIKRVRNKIAAHLLDNETKEPVSPSAVFAELQEVWKGDPNVFFAWLVGGNSTPHSVRSCIQSFFKELDAKYPGALQELMLAEQKKQVGYPAGLPTMLDGMGNIIR